MLKLRKWIFWLLLLLLGAKVALAGETLSIEECYTLARQNYPLTRKLDLVRQSGNNAYANAAKAYLPQLSINGQATYQSQTINFSDVFGDRLPAGMTLPTFSKDQYKAQAEVSQAIYDGGAVSNQRTVIRADQALQTQQAEVSLYAVNEQVDRLFFTVLLVEEQLKQNALRLDDLQQAIDQTSARLDNGTAFRSNLDELKAEQIRANMNTIELRSSRTACLNMLGILIGKPLEEDTHLVSPQATEADTEIRRPELKWYELQQSRILADEHKLRSDYLPRLSAFFQGAYGRPTLNFVSNEFGAWYIAGARLSWNLGSLYTLKNNKRNLEISRENIGLEKEAFLLNTRMNQQQEQADIRKYRQLIAEDEKAIELRSAVKRSAAAQLENGVITTHDYITQLNAEHEARSGYLLHQVQLLQALYYLKHTSGN